MTFKVIHADEFTVSEIMESTILDVENLLGVSVTIHDTYGRLTRGPGLPLISKQRGSHRKNYLCGVGFCQKCSMHCGVGVNRQATESARPFVHECWKGLAEIVVPVHHNGIHVMTVFAGTWRVEPWLGGSFKGRTAEWTRRRSRLSELSRPEIDKRIRVLRLFARGLLGCLQDMEKEEIHVSTRKQEIARFLRLSNPEAADIASLAANLHVSVSRASHIVRELFGESFQELLKHERINRAKALLVSTDLPIKEIAQRAGLENQYYFSRLFRRETGCTPSGYRATVTDHASQ